MLLSKGFEIEMYTGTPSGDVVGLSDKIVANLEGNFAKEPDSRNVEYITSPSTQYERQLCELLRPRRKIREYLQRLGNYTFIPGSTLSLGGAIASTVPTRITHTMNILKRPTVLQLLLLAFISMLGLKIQKHSYGRVV